jgi:hypothetical protein
MQPLYRFVLADDTEASSRAPIQQRPQQFGEGDRIELGLVQNVAGPGLSRLFDEDWHAGVRKDNDRQISECFLGANAGEHLDPIRLGHHQIQENKVRSKSSEEFKSFGPINRHGHVVLLLCQKPLTHVRHDSVIFDDEDLFHRYAVPAPDLSEPTSGQISSQREIT